MNMQHVLETDGLGLLLWHQFLALPVVDEPPMPNLSIENAKCYAGFVGAMQCFLHLGGEIRFIDPPTEARATRD